MCISNACGIMVQSYAIKVVYLMELIKINMKIIIHRFITTLMVLGLWTQGDEIVEIIVSYILCSYVPRHARPSLGGK